MTLTLSATALAAKLGFGTWKLSYRSKSCGRRVYDSHLDPDGVGIWRPRYFNGRLAYYWLDTK